MNLLLCIGTMESCAEATYIVHQYTIMHEASYHAYELNEMGGVPNIDQKVFS